MNRKFQFTLLSLIIFTVILGPLIGMKVRDFVDAQLREKVAVWKNPIAREFSNLHGVLKKDYGKVYRVGPSFPEEEVDAFGAKNLWDKDWSFRQNWVVGSLDDAKLILRLDVYSPQIGYGSIGKIKIIDYGAKENQKAIERLSALFKKKGWQFEVSKAGASRKH